tara:strand:- start:1045 stop:1740 length:696 start_codon:yes stop_codon:yes gene_type:complete
VNESGVIYVAVDPQTAPQERKYNPQKKQIIKEFFHSFNSLRATNPFCPVTVFSDYEEILRSSLDYERNKIQNDFGLKPKVFGIKSSPYNRTIFLDADTEIKGSIEPLFSYLNNHDLCLAKEFIIPSAFNTGVISFRDSPAIKAFIDLWYKSMDNNHEKVCDQGCFNNIVKFKYKNPPKKLIHIKKIIDPISIKVLDSKIWNLRVAEKKQLALETFDFSENIILHMRGLSKK